MTQALATYLPQDRRQAIALGRPLPERVHGAALFADISGFTQLTEALTSTLGPRRGAELVTDQINAVYDALIVQVDAFHGSVISFAGDAISCWFDEADGDAARRAASCAWAMQSAMRAFEAIHIPDGASVAVGLKVSVAAGPARRFVVGDPMVQLIDTLAGATVARVVAGEQLASRGELLADEAVVAALGADALVAEWRAAADGGDRFAVLGRVGRAAEAAPPRLATPDERLLRPWLLPAIYDRETAGQGEFLTELRPAAAVFVRFAGIDYDGDDGAGSQLDSFIRTVQRIFARYGGTMLQLLIGDKGSYLYAAFGAPVAHEDDARRAVLAAGELQADLAGHSSITPLQIGINQGMLRCGAYGGRSRRTYGALGDEVNLAARLMQLAAPAETLVTEAVRSQVAAEVTLTPRAPLRVKGKAEPLSIFGVQGVRQWRAMRLQEPTYALPMVGRERELAAVEQVIERAIAGQAQVLAISADAGIGKSRLLAEGIRLARRRGMTGYGGVCQATGTRSPYLVWQPIWRALFDINPDAPARRQIRVLEELIEEWAADRRDATPLLGPLLGLPLEENAFTASLAPHDRQGALHALLRACLVAAASEARDAGAGLLIVLEDAHWIDVASDDLLHDLAHAAADLPVVFALAFRPPDSTGRAPQTDRLPSVTAVELHGLGEFESEQLIRAKLAQLFPARVGAVAAALIARLTALAQGNPFYLEELLNYLRDRAIDPRNAAAVSAVELPDSLHRLILSRLDQLSARQQVTLKVASVIGRRFLVAWLRDAFAGTLQTSGIDEDLVAWVQLDLTLLDTPEPELAYLFKHIVTQEVAYVSLSATTRAALHERLASFLEGLESGPDRYVDLLAYHYEQSENLAKKRRYLRRAGEAAAARYANDAALSYLGRALDLAPDDDQAERYALLLAREAVYDVRGDRAAQAEDLAQLRALAGIGAEVAPQAEVALRLARHAERTGDYPAAVARAREAVDWAHQAGRLELEAAGCQRWGWALLRQREYDAARAQLDRSLDLAAQAGDRRQACLTLNDLGGLEAEQGSYTSARFFYERAAELARELGDRRQETYVLGNLGTIAAELGDLSGGRGYLEQSLAFAHIIGDLFLEAYTLANLGFLLALLGDYAAARSTLELALDNASAVGDPHVRAHALNALGLVALHQGDAPAARDSYGRALELARQLGLTALAGQALRGIGNVALATGDPQAAADAYRESLATLRAAGDPAQAAEPLAGLARAAIASGDLAAALASVEEIYAQIERGSLASAEEPMAVYLTCYETLRAAGDPRAAPLLRRAHAELLGRAERIADRQARQIFLEQVPAHRELAAAWAAQQATTP